VSNKPVLLLVVFTLFFRISIQAQVSRLNIEESDDVVFRLCDSAKLSLFVFRPPIASPLSGNYNDLIHEFSKISDVSLIDISMNPFPGCTKPKRLELCGFDSLNRYFTFDPLYGYVYTNSVIWRDFVNSKYFKNKTVFNKTTYTDENDSTKRNIQSPFYSFSSEEGLKLILDYLNSRTPKKSIFIDSVACISLIKEEIKLLNPVIKNLFFGVKIGSLFGKLYSKDELSLKNDDISINESIVHGNGLDMIFQLEKGNHLVHRVDLGIKKIRILTTSSLINNLYFLDLYTSKYSMGYSLDFGDVKAIVGGGLHFDIRNFLTNPSVLISAYDVYQTGFNKFDFGGNIGASFVYSPTISNSILVDMAFSRGFLNLDSRRGRSSYENNYYLGFFSVSIGFLTRL
jgi:hypothetical protein